jgi:hypothetical protein
MELIWGVVGMKQLGEKKLFPGLLALRSTVLIFNIVLSINFLLTRRKRKW